MRKITQSAFSLAARGSCRRNPLACALGVIAAAGVMLAAPDIRKASLLGPILAGILCLFAAVALAPRLANASDHGGNPNTISSAISALKEGNKRFAAGAPTHPHQSLELLDHLAKEGQTPFAAVLACSDSRVAIEELFDLGFGDLFVVRAAGSVPGTDQVGSLEYAVAHLGVPVILVMGHTNCGAVSAAVSGANEPGALGELLEKLSPIASAVKHLSDSRRLQTAIELSAIVFREQLPLLSPVLAQAVSDGKLAIVSGVYDIATGEVTMDEGRWAGAASPQSGDPHGTPSDSSAHGETGN